MTIITDTDSLLALTFEEDALHKRVLNAYGLIPGTIPFVLDATLAEYATLATIRYSKQQAKKYVKEIVESHELITLTIEDCRDAIELYGKQTAKKVSLFDCYVMATARRLQLDCIFSFDGGYEQNGFILIENYFKVSA